MELEIKADDCTISTRNGKIKLQISGADTSEVLQNIPIDEILQFLDVDDMLAHVGEDRAIKYFGIDVAE